MNAAISRLRARRASHPRPRRRLDGRGGCCPCWCSVDSIPAPRPFKGPSLSAHLLIPASLSGRLGPSQPACSLRSRSLFVRAIPSRISRFFTTALRRCERAFQCVPSLFVLQAAYHSLPTGPANTAFNALHAAGGGGVGRSERSDSRRLVLADQPRRRDRVQRSPFVLAMPVAHADNRRLAPPRAPAVPSDNASENSAQSDASEPATSKNKSAWRQPPQTGTTPTIQPLRTTPQLALSVCAGKLGSSNIGICLLTL